MEYNDMVQPCGCKSYMITIDEEGRETYLSLPCECKKNDKN